MELNSVENILNFAIEKEEEAAEFYEQLAAKMAPDYMKEIFLGFAQEEKQHKARLLHVKQGGQLLSAKEKVIDLKIGDYLVAVEPSGDMNYQQALIIAMKAEKAAFKLYMDLSKTTDDVSLKNLFVALAQEEAKHKLRFEIEFDENIMQEN
jgi:rubrerythrin